ncbi:MAG: hypothetical protein KDC87_21560 [Planctomycetes bacterium]|nr:hypothetical protein [Planctomycetota bacterium]
MKSGGEVPGVGVRVFSVLLLVTVLSPVVQNFRAHPIDGFPLSYYPMFSKHRHGRTSLVHAVGRRADGTSIDLDCRFASTGGMNQARHKMNRMVKGGRSSVLAKTVARRVRRQGVAERERLVSIQIVRDTFVFDRFFAGDRTPEKRRVLGQRKLAREQGK